jgi:hypothetical protein
VTEDEVEAVAEELAKAGGVAWYPGRSRGPLLRIVSDRYRDRARLAIAALDRYRAHKAGVAPADTPDSIDVGPIPEQPQAHAPSDSGIGSALQSSTASGRAEGLSMPGGEDRGGAEPTWCLSEALDLLGADPEHHACLTRRGLCSIAG